MNKQPRMTGMVLGTKRRGIKQYSNRKCDEQAIDEGKCFFSLASLKQENIS